MNFDLHAIFQAKAKCPRSAAVRVGRNGPIDAGIDTAIQSFGAARTPPVLQFGQRRSAGEREVRVEHPDLVQNYRAAHDIAVRRSQGKADTEDLRSALIGYRSLFDELLHADVPELTH